MTRGALLPRGTCPTVLGLPVRSVREPDRRLTPTPASQQKGDEVILAKALPLALTLGAIALATPTAAHGPQTFNLRADNQQTKTIRVAPARVTLGDEQVTSGVLVDVNGQRAGTFGITCTQIAVYPQYTLERCDGWGQLTGGQLTIAGISQSNTSHATWAITGGTGSYQTARGEIQLNQLNNHQTAVTVTLAGL